MEQDGADRFLGSLCPFPSKKLYMSQFGRMGSYLRFPLNKGSAVKTKRLRGFPGGAVVESLPANAGDTGSGPGLGGSHMPRSN